jgi:excisionase family DNA binding protein
MGEAAHQHGRGERLLTAVEAGGLLGVNPRWLLAEARERRVPHHRLGRQVRFSEAQIREILAATEVRPYPSRTKPAAEVIALPRRLFPDEGGQP